jgi:hypothetical protein
VISRREDYEETTLDQIRYDERRVMGLFRVFVIALATEHIWSLGPLSINEVYL